MVGATRPATNDAMETDPTALRARAARWRKIAREYDAETAAGLIEAAQVLERRAAAIEAERGVNGGSDN